MNNKEQFLKELGDKYGYKPSDIHEEICYLNEKILLILLTSKNFKALFATNKSALAAMSKMRIENIPDREIMAMLDLVESIQSSLIYHLTNKGAIGFWELCYKFTGWEGK